MGSVIKLLLHVPSFVLWAASCKGDNANDANDDDDDNNGNDVAANDDDEIFRHVT